MAAVFAGTPQAYNGAFRANQLVLSFANTPTAGHLVTRINFSYQQEISMLYELGSAFVYYVGGRARGKAEMERVIGPAPLGGSFIQNMNDICKPDTVVLDASGGCPKGASSSGGGGAKYTLQDCVLESVGGNIQVEDSMMHENMGLMFANLDI